MGKEIYQTTFDRVMNVFYVHKLIGFFPGCTLITPILDKNSEWEGNFQ